MRCALLGGEPRQREIVQVDEAVQQLPGRIDLHREAPFGEIDLHVVGALRRRQPRTSVSCSRSRSCDELLARVARDLVRRIHQAQRGG